jgi:tRNA threonylcarbamoyladenosine biosynthesis protein TsaE
MQKITNSEKETFEFAKKFAKKLKGGEVIGLVGDLGAGKTVFVKGLAAELGVKQNITSPTFVLMKVYKIRNLKSEIRNLIHIDAYRVKNAEDLTAIGAKEYFNRPDAITVIEWADKIKKILPNGVRFIALLNKGKYERRIILNS